MTTFSFAFMARIVRYGVTPAIAANTIASPIQNRAASRLLVMAATAVNFTVPL